MSGIAERMVWAVGKIPAERRAHVLAAMAAALELGDEAAARRLYGLACEAGVLSESRGPQGTLLAHVTVCLVKWLAVHPRHLSNIRVLARFRGFKPGILRQAARNLGVIASRRAGSRSWVWSLPAKMDLYAGLLAKARREAAAAVRDRAWRGRVNLYPVLAAPIADRRAPKASKCRGTACRAPTGPNAAKAPKCTGTACRAPTGPNAAKALRRQR